jgi:hypothetical protein
MQNNEGLSLQDMQTLISQRVKFLEKLMKYLANIENRTLHLEIQN